MAVVYAFGDSITWGAWDHETGGWTSRLRIKIEQSELSEGRRRYTELFNLGISGETSAGAVKRFDQELAVRERGEKKVILFAFGANDSCYIPSQSQYKVDVAAYEQNMRQLFSAAKEQTDAVYALTILPVVDRLTESPAGKDKSRLTKYFIPYNEVLFRLSEELGIELIDVHAAFASRNHEELFSDDGLHPNGAGHQLICEQVYQAIAKELS